MGASGVRRIAIVGSGQAGLVAAHGLARAGHEVTVYSDRTPEQWLNESRPTGAAGRFQPALAYERELGLAHWEQECPRVEGVHLTFCPKVGNRLVTMLGRLDAYGQAIDLRLQSHRWLTDLPKAGTAQVIVEKVSVERLDEIAKQHDLTIVATGRGPLAELFPRDAERSVYTTPQRKLAMAIVTGGTPIADCPFTPVKFNFFAADGEAFWIPYYHRDHGAAWCVLFEAKQGGALDRFDGCATGHDVVARAKQCIAEVMPWDAAWAKHIELADDNGWLCGAITPTIRAPVGRLPSGRIAMPLGDTATSLDPIAGQGANLGNKHAKHVVAAIGAHEGAFDADWMTRTFEAFWADQGAPTVRFNNLFLEPMTAAGKQMLIAQAGSDGTTDSPQQRIADAVTQNFPDPRRATDAFLDVKQARALIRERTGRAWPRMVIGGALRVGARQAGRLFGRATV